MTILSKLQSVLGEVRENEPMAKHTSFKLGGPAEYFFEAKSAQEVMVAVQLAGELKLPVFVFGGGSNMLVMDAGIIGLVVKMVNRGFKIEGDLVYVDAGVPSGLLSLKTVEAGLTGLEWMAGLPGTIGGAIRGNAGMFGGEVGDSLVEVRCNDKIFQNSECEFAYRQSIFKRLGGFVILDAVFKLKPSESIADSKAQMKSYLLKKHQVQPIQYPSVGSIFANWHPSSFEDIGLLKKYLDLDDTPRPSDRVPLDCGRMDGAVPLTKHGDIPAGWLIDRCDLKKTQVGGIMVSDLGANFMIKVGEAKTEHVLELIALVKSRVRNMTHGLVQLHEEVQIIN